jgi:hypothetical protein
VQEEADGVPADGEHPAIFPLPFAVRRLGSGRYYGSGNGRGDAVAWLVTGRNINALR